jgi:hypothetical protein
MRIPLAALLSIAVAAGGVQAQALPEPSAAGTAQARIRTLTPGDVVRVEAAAGRYEGTVTRVTPDTLVVAEGARIDAIPRADVTRLERFAGRSSRGRAIAIGAGTGLVSGVVIGAVVGRMIGKVDCGEIDGPDCVSGEHDGTIQGVMIAEGALIGSLVGAMFGPVFRRTRWENAADAFPLAAGVAPSGGVAAGISLRF